MADESQKVGDLMKQIQGMLALNPEIGPRMEGFWKTQDGILEETEAFSKAWFERRHDAARTAPRRFASRTATGPTPRRRCRPCSNGNSNRSGGWRRTCSNGSSFARIVPPA